MGAVQREQCDVQPREHEEDGIGGLPGSQHHGPTLAGPSRQPLHPGETPDLAERGGAQLALPRHVQADEHSRQLRHAPHLQRDGHRVPGASVHHVLPLPGPRPVHRALGEQQQQQARLPAGRGGEQGDGLPPLPGELPGQDQAGREGGGAAADHQVHLHGLRGPHREHHGGSAGGRPLAQAAWPQSDLRAQPPGSNLARQRRVPFTPGGRVRVRAAQEVRAGLLRAEHEHCEHDVPGLARDGVHASGAVHSGAGDRPGQLHLQ